MMEIRTHKYAEKAFPLVQKMQKNTCEAKYRTLVLNFPTMIMQSGLAQSIGFLMAKGKDEHKTILEHIQKILERPNLYEDILKSNIQQYQILTRQALDATSWLKRYTQALLKKEGEN